MGKPSRRSRIRSLDTKLHLEPAQHCADCGIGIEPEGYGICFERTGWEWFCVACFDRIALERFDECLEVLGGTQ